LKDNALVLVARLRSTVAKKGFEGLEKEVMVLAKRDYYEVLGVSKNATEQEIKRAHRQLAKKYHPDVNDAPDAEAKFKEAQEAYEALSDPQKKAAYDQFGHAGMEGMGGAGGFGGFGGGSGFGGFEDLFDGMFGGGGGFGGFGGSRGRNANAARRGADLEKTLIITFEEAAFGTTKEITVNREEECTKCAGSGARSKDDVKTCGQCSGSGRVVGIQNTILGRIQTQTVCPKCSGNGKEVVHKCDKCHGRGTNNKTKTIEVKIPAGVNHGQQIRLSGQGEAGSNGGPAGDLYVAFRMQPHDFFTREEFNLHCEVPITFTQATLGAEIEVPTLDGRISLKIPNGTQPGTEFRLRGKGVKHIGRESYGDLYVKVKVAVPKKVNGEQKKLLEQFEVLEDKTGTLWDKFKKAFK